MLSNNQSMELESVARILNENHCCWCIFAGSAAAIYGAKREMTDVDILVDMNPHAVSKMFPHFSQLRFGVLRHGRMEIIAPRVKLRTSTAEYPWRFDANVKQRICKQLCFGGCYPLMSPEDVIVIKCILQRGKERGKFDLDDVREMFLERSRTISMPYILRRAVHCNALERVTSALRLLEIPFDSVPDRISLKEGEE